MGRRSTTPQAAAGSRTEPPLSVPRARSTSPAATAAPDPPPRAGQHPPAVPRVARAAGGGVLGGDADGELGEVERGHDERPRLAQPSYDGGVAVGHVVGQERRRAQVERTPPTSMLSLTPTVSPASGTRGLAATNSSRARDTQEMTLLISASTRRLLLGGSPGRAPSDRHAQAGTRAERSRAVAPSSTVQLSVSMTTP